ncbi:polyphosphate kinase 2 family protein [Sphingomonas sp. LaA6.9]|uniref:polyphosphate kinase 2 family protein n=1 Tax=Sphingomonas sp. LaA6.9 TaxID=2919914 RepID=UPI001F502C83|nr:polyphosphate kinase [Sphingomonas sp. LaA6.9]MCJ8159324.1 polyphosphate kinase [Sphingomonas sp. LaA6.9]
MPIDLSDYEKGEKFDGDYDEALKSAQERLSHIQAAYICRGARAILVFEGWDAAGKGGAIGRLTAELDPRYFEVWPIQAPTVEEKERHFLWRFWQKLPGASDINIFDRSWYGRVLVERVEGFASEAEWRRGYDEINEFEAQQRDCGTTIVKLFLHITQEEQDKRIRARLDHPWKRWKTGTEDFRNRARRDDYLAALQDMFDRTDTRWAPWKVFDANNKKAVRVAILNYVADRLSANVNMEPPALDPEVLKVAAEQIGYRAD